MQLSHRLPSERRLPLSGFLSARLPRTPPPLATFLQIRCRAGRSVKYGLPSCPCLTLVFETRPESWVSEWVSEDYIVIKSPWCSRRGLAAGGGGRLSVISGLIHMPLRSVIVPLAHLSCWERRRSRDRDDVFVRMGLNWRNNPSSSFRLSLRPDVELWEKMRDSREKKKSRASDGCHIVSAKHFGLIEYVSSFTDVCIKYGSANVKSCIMLKQIWLNISINKWMSEVFKFFLFSHCYYYLQVIKCTNTHVYNILRIKEMWFLN